MKKWMALMTACLVGMAPLGAASLSLRAGYTETTLSETCFDTQLTFQQNGLATGVRFYSGVPSWQVALRYRGAIGPCWVWECKGDALTDEYGSVLDSESTFGLGGGSRHFYGGLAMGVQHMLRFHEDMDKPLFNTNLAVHGWIGTVWGPVDLSLAYESSTLFLYSYQWLAPIISLNMNWNINERWDMGLTGMVRLADAAPNEKVSMTLVSFSTVVTRRF